MAGTPRVAEAPRILGWPLNVVHLTPLLSLSTASAQGGIDFSDLVNEPGRGVFGRNAGTDPGVLFRVDRVATLRSRQRPGFQLLMPAIGHPGNSGPLSNHISEELPAYCPGAAHRARSRLFANRFGYGATLREQQPLTSSHLLTWCGCGPAPMRSYASPAPTSSFFSEKGCDRLPVNQSETTRQS
jgi:hypothetical protein